MPTTETRPTEPAVTVIDDVSTEQMCGVCSHPMSTHDMISTRFCAATVAGALARGCVCP